MSAVDTHQLGARDMAGQPFAVHGRTGEVIAGDHDPGRYGDLFQGKALGPHARGAIVEVAPRNASGMVLENIASSSPPTCRPGMPALTQSHVS